MSLARVGDESWLVDATLQRGEDGKGEMET